jgi:hypothetical protein
VPQLLIDVLGLDERWAREDSWQLVTAVVTVGGFYLAWRQLSRTATAQEQSNLLLTKVQRRLVINDLLLLLPRIQEVEDDVHHKFAGNDRPRLASSLVGYAQLCTEVAVAVSQSDPDEEQDFVEMLENVSLLAKRAKGELLTDPGRDQVVIMKRILKLMPTVSTRSHTLIARLKRESGDE